MAVTKLLTLAALLLQWTPVSAASSLDNFITKEKAIALQGVLNNIGPNGAKVAGAHAGLVVASPSKTNPDYFYTWTRDSALTLKVLVDEFIQGNKGLQSYIEDYYHAQAVLQTVYNPSGAFLPYGKGLGEPKFNVDGTEFTGAWGRPQRDGPALRAIALMSYSNWLILNGGYAKAKNVVWPIIANDLSYVGQYWNSTGFDLWEEVSGSSFFTIQNQYRSLIQGAELALVLGVKCAGCAQAPNIVKFLQSFWNGKYLVANINVNNGRSGLDANTMLGSIAVFDVWAPCDSTSLQPCHSKSLANLKALVDAFRNPSLYPINANIPATSGVAIGRYPEDTYQGGNPWYLCTLAAAELLYDAVAQWKHQLIITIDAISLPFFQALYPSARQRTYHPILDKEYAAILSAVTAYADSFVAVVQQYTPADGGLAEQFAKAPPGAPLSAADLTWSYAAFLSMARRRQGVFPASWLPPSLLLPTNGPSTLSTPRTYAPATAAGAPNLPPVACTVAVTFEVNATTYYGENVYISGNVPELGSWNLAAAMPMTAANYTAQRPEWFVEVDLPGGETVSYTYVRQENCNQPYIYETVNRTLVVPACGATPQSIFTNDAWTGPVGTPGSC